MASRRACAPSAARRGEGLLGRTGGAPAAVALRRNAAVGLGALTGVGHAAGCVNGIPYQRHLDRPGRDATFRRRESIMDGWATGSLRRASRWSAGSDPRRLVEVIVRDRNRAAREQALATLERLWTDQPERRADIWWARYDAADPDGSLLRAYADTLQFSDFKRDDLCEAAAEAGRPMP
ncbi:hypothetical protein [Dactylosporangium sp. NPDC051541]|uniref:hypothetical protein n=1 Tax=Dactylosporangium sp. NPDC051541 TaxID=3363977 RepID=UPI00379F4EE5